MSQHFWERCHWGRMRSVPCSGYSELLLSAIHRYMCIHEITIMIYWNIQAAMADHMIVITRFLSKETRDWNYNMTLWRSSQLFACSFAYTALSVITGTVNAVRLTFFHRDLTMWSSFRVSNQVLTKVLIYCVSEMLLICSGEGGSV